jgi:predicted Zn finger-like uncharacterized protein
MAGTGRVMGTASYREATHMAIQASCSHCEENYRLPDAQLGKRVRCKSCGETFLVQDEDEDVPVLEAASAEQKRPHAGGEEVDDLVVLEDDQVEVVDDDEEVEEVVNEEVVEVVDDEEVVEVVDESDAVPRSRRDKDEADVVVVDEEYEEEEDSSPRRRDRDEEVDEYVDEDEEEPRQAGKSKGLLIAGVAAAGLLVVGGGSGLAWYLSRSPTPAGTTSAAVTSNPGDGKDKAGPVNPNPVGGNNTGGAGGDNTPISDVTTALNALKDSRSDRKKQGARYLAAATVDAGQRGEVEQVLASLSEDPDFDVAQAALTALRRWSPRTAIGCLEKRLQNPDNQVHNDAMDQLSRIDDDRAAEVLAAQFKVAGRGTQASRNLERLGRRAEKYVLPYYNDASFTARTEARALLRSLGTNETVLLEQSITDLGSKETDRCKAALDEVSKHRPANKALQDKGAKALAGLLASRDSVVPRKALDALETWATNDNVPTLCEALADPFKIDQVLKILAKLRDERMIKPLVQHLNTSKERQKQISTILISYGSKVEDEVLPLLTSIRPDLRTNAAEILAKVGTKKSLPELKKYVDRYNRVIPEEADLGRTAQTEIQAREKGQKDK